MNHADHVHLLRKGISAPGGLWADLGAGSGAFTLALAELLGPAGQIIATDRDAGALRQAQSAMRTQFPAVMLQTQVSDFSRGLDVPPLDGVLMANSLHFQRDRLSVLRHVFAALKPGGILLIVEYNTDRGNTWVPYPFAYPTWETLAAQAGFIETRLLEKRPSRFLGEIYSAASLRP
jgi:ubiquinone/menaquinone biosynthesis C-methylase UbiE